MTMLPGRLAWAALLVSMVSPQESQANPLGDIVDGLIVDWMTHEVAEQAMVEYRDCGIYFAVIGQLHAAQGNTASAESYDAMAARALAYGMAFSDAIKEEEAVFANHVQERAEIDMQSLIAREISMEDYVSRYEPLCVEKIEDVESGLETAYDNAFSWLLEE